MQAATLRWLSGEDLVKVECTCRECRTSSLAMDNRSDVHGLGGTGAGAGFLPNVGRLALERQQTRPPVFTAGALCMLKR
ncbi:hypothetical protein E2562_029150 [Oryza meyeriana var. granulata]|uniref:Uncharacterized protein n=1 Tax=Oryza meyeriana var. granulata TaxID=110450 RepID=A0A6G1E2H2_9ORYZ|nr:hypothetical protein E2562_029150 [Oryza meyeriana var. granulata]